MVLLIYIWRSIRLLWRALRYLIGLLLLVFLLQRSTYPVNIQWNAVAIIVSQHQFDYVGWELGALGSKISQSLFGLHPFMAEADRTQVVRDYMARLAELQGIEAEIDAIFVDPDIPDPQEASVAPRIRRDNLRDELAGKQALVEGILEGQVASILVDQGFGLAGQLLPPIAMRFTRLPDLLIVSPRDRIRFDISINVDPLPVDEKVVLEKRVDDGQNVSSLIVPLGGLALYPAMVQETASIVWAVETFAHEWIHHYLFAFPLGYTIEFSGEARTINETTANLFGQEVGRLVLERYYLDLVRSLPPGSEETPLPPVIETQPPAFDFNLEMHQTRVTVDQLLAEGMIEEAESYMEERRRLFVENGYAIRKLNQAYFAFYGGYQSGTPGVGGEDPIGPAVHDIRQRSPSLYDFVVNVRSVTSREALLILQEHLSGDE